MARRRRRRRLTRAVPWLLALGFVVVVGLFVYEAVRTSADRIVAEAESIRRGDPNNGIARNPEVALDMLERLLAREPEHFDALIEAARSWASLRSYDNAVEMLERANAVAAAQEDTIGQVRALRQGVGYLISNRKFDDAIEWAQTVASIQPHNILFKLNYGLALYNSSTAIQNMVLRRFVPILKVTDDGDVFIVESIESYVTDIWGSSDTEALITQLAPKADEGTRDEIRQQLVDSRDLFGQAADVFVDYPNAPAFDQGVCRGYVELLRRSGRVYDAHIEAAIALRQPNLSTAMSRIMLQTQAQCLLVLDEVHQAANLYEEIVKGFRAAGTWPPPTFVQSLIDNRVLAEDWDWILANHAEYEELTNNDVLLQYAHAAALSATGDLDAAVEEIQQPFTTLSLGTRLPPSVRSFPDRRRRILLLAHSLFDQLDDTNALTALDALIDNFPHDSEGLEARIQVQIERDRLELAMEDAFALLTSDRRRPEDFQRWLDIANELSLQRYGLSLDERATEMIEKDLEFQAASAQAGFETNQGRPQDSWRSDTGSTSSAAYLTKAPALAWTTIRERIPRNQLERARNDLRRLSQDHPEVQEFRVQLGKLLVRQGRLDSAVAEFRDVLSQVPSDTELLDLTTRIEFSSGNSEQAAELVNQMILHDPLGVGAVRYGKNLLERGRIDEAQDLIKRLLRWPDFTPGRDLFIMSARAFLARGDIDSATALLVNLSNQFPNNEDVALLGLEIGLSSGDEGVIASAVAHLRPMITGLLPDQVGDLAWNLLDYEYFEEMLEIFPEVLRDLPVLRPALRPLAEASKAIGDTDEADRLLELLDDSEALRDRFLLMSFVGRTEDASRRLRLTTGRDDQQQDLDFCLLSAASLMGFQSMYDLVPVVRLRDLGVDLELDPASLELLDAVMRIMPSRDRLDEVVPRDVVENPLKAYPNAGPDVVRLLDALKQDPERTAETMRALVLLMMSIDRPFWWRESQFLAEQVLDHLPGMHVVSLHLAQQYLDSELPNEALNILKYLLSPTDVDPRTLEMFMEATRAFGHDEWGLAMAYEAKDDDAVLLVLAESLRHRRYVEESLPHYEAFLERNPTDIEAWSGIIQAYAFLGRPRSTVESVKTALELHPQDDELAQVCTAALSRIPTLDNEGQRILELLTSEYPQNLAPYEPLAQIYLTAGSLDRLEPLIDALVQQLQGSTPELWSEEAAVEATVCRRLGRLARSAGLRTYARQLNKLALQIEPGSVGQFQELASLEIEDGNLDIARSYLEVLSIVRPYDREGPLTLARLLFEQIGQPHIAADIIRRTYGRQIMPPAAVEVLAAESYLRGDSETALHLFRKISHHPAVTPDTFLTVGRIAFASGLDDEARGIFTQYQKFVGLDHPTAGRVSSLLALCGPAPKAAGTGKGAASSAAPEAVEDEGTEGDSQAEAVAVQEASTDPDSNSSADQAGDGLPSALAADGEL